MTYIYFCVISGLIGIFLIIYAYIQYKRDIKKFRTDYELKEEKSKKYFDSLKLKHKDLKDDIQYYFERYNSIKEVENELEFKESIEIYKKEYLDSIDRYNAFLIKVIDLYIKECNKTNDLLHKRN